MDRRAAGLILAATTVPVAGAAQAPAPDSAIFAVSPASRLDVRTGRAGLLGGLAHAHLVRARAFHGTIVYFPAEPERSRVTLSVATDSLAILTEADSQDVAKMTRAMREATLRVSTFPEIRFESREVAATEGGLRVTGDWTMVGQTRSVTVEVTLEIAGDTLRAAAQFPLKQTDFGIKPYRTGLGTVKVSDEVRCDIAVVAGRVP